MSQRPPLSDASEISHKACLAFLCDFKNRRQPMSQRPPLSDASEISRKACLAFIVYKSVLGISICYRDINLFCERHVSCQYYERAKNYSCRRETRRPQNSPKFLFYDFTKIPERLYLAFQGFLCIRRDPTNYLCSVSYFLSVARNVDALAGLCHATTAEIVPVLRISVESHGRDACTGMSLRLCKGERKLAS